MQKKSVYTLLPFLGIVQQAYHTFPVVARIRCDFCRIFTKKFMGGAKKPPLEGGPKGRMRGVGSSRKLLKLRSKA